MFARLPFRALRFAFPAAALLTAGLLTTCTDGAPPTDLALDPMAMLAVNPVFNPALAVEGSADINRIRITAYLAGTDSILGSVVVDVDPNASEWTLDVSVVIPTGPNPQVVLTVELVNVTNGQETVQWSGQTAPITVTAGTTPTVESVQVVRGSLGNLTVTSVSIVEPILELLEGESTQVNASATSSDPNFQPEIFWASLDPGVASISPTGVLTALAPGSVRVVATAGAVADTASTVVRARATGVAISPDGVLLQSLGEDVQFQGSVVDIRGDVIQGEAVSWGLESTEVLEDLGNGLYRSMSRGSTVVTATSVNHPTLTATVLVEVEQAVAAVDVSPETQTLQAVGQTAQFSAQALDGNGNVIEGMSFVWSSSDTQVATVDQSGLATGAGTGTVTIFAETTSATLAAGAEETPVPGTVGSATLVVEQLVDRVEVTPSTHTFKALDEVQPFTAQALDLNGNVVPGMVFIWSTGDATIVTVDAAGSAKAVAPGATTVTATTLGISGSAEVSVQPEASSVTVTPETHTFSALRQTQQFQAEAKDANGNLIPNAVFVWTTSAPAIASVDNAGLVTAQAAGTATITASSGGKTGSATVTVTPLPAALSWLVQPSNAIVGVPVTPAPKVQALDGNGYLVSTFNGLVTLTELDQYTIEGGPEGAFSISQAPGIQGTPVPFESQLQLVVLGGSPAVAAVNGVATFSNLIFQSGGSYSLRAESPGLTSAESNAVDVTNALADISVTKTVDNATPNEGDTVTFVATVTNLGPETATGVKVQDVASAGLDYVSHTVSQGVVDTVAQLWDVGTLAVGETATFQVRVLVENGTAGTTLTNEVYLSAMDQTDPVGSNNSAQVSVNPVGLDISLSKTVDNASPSEGDKIVYTVVANNLGPANATNVVIRDTIPTGLILDSIQATGGSWNGGTEEWTIPSLASGAANTIRFFVTVGSGTVGQFLQNEAQRTSTDQTDTSPPNDVALAGINVQPLPAPISYNTAGNTELIAGAYTAPSTPHTTDVRTLIGTTPSLVVTSVGTFTTTDGGSVTIEADGDFSYTPKPGDQALDQFVFTVHTGKTATISWTKEDMVWYVDNAATSTHPGTGVSNDPFETLAEADVAQGGAAPPPPPPSPVPEIVYFLHGGIGPYQGGFILGTNERLQGEAAGLSLGTFPGLIPVGSGPTITNGSGDAVALGSGSTLRGVGIDVANGTCVHVEGVNGGWIDQVNISGCVAHGVHILNSTGTLALSQVNITDISNTPLTVEGGNPVVNFNGSLVQNSTTGHLHLFQVLNTTGGSVNLDGGPFTDDSSGTGSVIIDGATGSVSVNMPMTIVDPGGPGILVQNSTAPVSFASVDISNLVEGGIQVDNNTVGVTFNNVDVTTTNGGIGISATGNAGAFTIGGGTVNTTDATAIIVDSTPFYGTFTSVTNLNNTADGVGVSLNSTSPGSLSVGTLDITTSGADGGLYLSNAGTVNVTNGASSITATGVSAIRVISTAIDMTFADVSASTPTPPLAPEGPSLTGSPITPTAPAPTADGISVTGTSSGTLTINGGAITTPGASGGSGVLLSGGNADVTYKGTITNTRADAWSVQVGNRSGGNAGFGGAITDSGRGVQIGGALGPNTGGVVKFSGGLNLTGAGAGGVAPFYANAAAANGQVEVIGTGNKIAPASPSLDGTPGLDITNTAIGPGGVTFESVSSNGGAQGIILQNTGAGAFTLTGLGTTVESGGIIQNTTGNGITLSSGQDVTLSNLRISYPAGHGIAANGVKNFTLMGSRVERTGDSETDVNGLDFNGLGGVGVVRASVIERTGADCVAITNSAGTLDFDLDGSTLDQCGNSDFYLGHGINLFASGSAAVNINVINGSTISDASQNGIYAITGGTAVVKVKADATGGQNNFPNNSISGIRGETSSSGSFDLKVVAGGGNQNVFTGTTFPIHTWQTGGGSTKFDIDGNSFTNGSVLAQFLADASAAAGSTMEGRFANNTATGFTGAPQLVKVLLDGDASGVVLLDGNDLTGTATGAADGIVGEIGGTGAGSLDFSVLSNTVAIGNSSGSLVKFNSDNTAQASRMCADVRNNDLDPPGVRGIYSLRQNLARLFLEDHTTNLSTMTDTEVENLLEAQNPAMAGDFSWLSSNAAYSSSGDRVEGMRPNTCKKPFQALPTGEADIEVRKTVSPMYGTVSDPFTYTVVVKNRGPGTATGVVVGDSVRPLRSPPWSVSQGTLSPGNPGDTIWNVGTLAPGDSAIMTASGLLDGVIKTNFAWLISLNESDPNAANDSDQVTFDGPSETPEPNPSPDQPPKPESPQDESPWLPDQKPWPREGSG